MKTKVIIIGWDNVLINTTSNITAAYRAAFRAIGSSLAEVWTAADTLNRLGKSPQSVWENKQLWGEQAETARQAYYECYANLKLQPDKSARSLLLQIKENLFPEAAIVVLTAKTQSILIREAEDTGFLRYFDRLVGSVGNPQLDKPAKGCFERAIEGFGVIRPDEVLYIGSKSHEKFALANGVRFLLVEPEEGAENETGLKTVFQRLRQG